MDGEAEPGTGDRILTFADRQHPGTQRHEAGQSDTRAEIEQHRQYIMRRRAEIDQRLQSLRHISRPSTFTEASATRGGSCTTRRAVRREDEPFALEARPGLGGSGSNSRRPRNPASSRRDMPDGLDGWGGLHAAADLEQEIDRLRHHAWEGRERAAARRARREFERREQERADMERREQIANHFISFMAGRLPFESEQQYENAFIAPPPEYVPR